MSDYDRIKKCKIEEVLKHVSLNQEDKPVTVKFGSKMVHMGSKRYLNFKAHGSTCVTCGLVGTHFWLERHKNQKTGRFHFNMYGTNGDGEEVMLTKDHIIPKAKGGSDEVDNFQVMCQPCNGSKGDNYLSEAQLIHQGKVQATLKILGPLEKLFLDTNNQYMDLVNTCDHDLVRDKDGNSECVVCKQKFLGHCPQSPSKLCNYESSAGAIVNDCVHCGKSFNEMVKELKYD